MSHSWSASWQMNMLLVVMEAPGKLPLIKELQRRGRVVSFRPAEPPLWASSWVNGWTPVGEWWRSGGRSQWGMQRPSRHQGLTRCHYESIHLSFPGLLVYQIYCSKKVQTLKEAFIKLTPKVSQLTIMIQDKNPSCARQQLMFENLLYSLDFQIKGTQI